MLGKLAADQVPGATPFTQTAVKGPQPFNQDLFKSEFTNSPRHTEPFDYGSAQKSTQIVNDAFLKNIPNEADRMRYLSNVHTMYPGHNSFDRNSPTGRRLYHMALGSHAVPTTNFISDRYSFAGYRPGRQQTIRENQIDRSPYLDLLHETEHLRQMPHPLATNNSSIHSVEDPYSGRISTREIGPSINTWLNNKYISYGDNLAKENKQLTFPKPTAPYNTNPKAVDARTMLTGTQDNRLFPKGYRFDRNWGMRQAARYGSPQGQKHIDELLATAPGQQWLKQTMTTPTEEQQKPPRFYNSMLFDRPPVNDPKLDENLRKFLPADDPAVQRAKEFGKTFGNTAAQQAAQPIQPAPVKPAPVKPALVTPALKLPNI